MSPTDRFVAETTFQVRYAETDTMGIVHHSNYIIYFEEGRSDYARQRGRPYSDFEKAGYFLTVSEINVRYAKPALYEQNITIRTWLTEMKSRGLTFNYEIIDSKTEERLASGHTKHICITHDGKVAQIPEMWRKWA